MHMADALISPEVGGVMWLAGGAAIVWCAKKVNENLDDFKVPLMGVMGAFIFAAQMMNFTIPGTGSSGHIVGALLLSVVLGPYAALLAISSVLVVQALFFADGGLLALGCNIFNMGVLPCLLAYPLIYKLIAGKAESGARIWLGCVMASVAGLVLGAFCVVLETSASGISELSFMRFFMLMTPIHIAIGFVEGLATAAVLLLIRESRPELLRQYNNNASGVALKRFSLKWMLISIITAALFTAAVLSWFASENPDGLEWSVAKITGASEPADENFSDVKLLSKRFQKNTAIFPDYALPGDEQNETNSPTWGKPNWGCSLAGIAGTAFTLLLAFSIGMLFRRHSLAAAPEPRE